MSERYLLVKHTEGWNHDRVCGWMDANKKPFDWFYPPLGDAFPDPKLYTGVVVFGGAPSANDEHIHPWVCEELKFIEGCLNAEKRFLGICLGAQMLARVLGSNIYPHEEGLTEIGLLRVEPTDAGKEFMAKPLTVLQWHKESYDLPSGAVNLARSDVFENQAFQYDERTLGVQFHPEVNPECLAIWQGRNKERSPDQFTDADRAAMMADAHEHDEAITAWIDGFLSTWTNQR